MKHLPYAPYIMHVIEQVSGIQFPIDTQHNLLKISNKTSISVARELREKGAAKEKGKVLWVLALAMVLHHLLLLLALLVPSPSLRPPLERSPTSLSS